jgi:CRP-like cAMP-binding protein
MEQIQKAVGSYQHAARFFADEGQLIKAIGAVKIILEIDARNDDAQKQLAQMNARRFGKVTLAASGLKPKPGIGAGARATSAIELAEGEQAVHAISSAIMPDLPPGDDEPLELDDGKPSRAAPAPVKRAAPPKVVVPPAPDKSYDLGGVSELDLEPPPPAPPPKAAAKPAAARPRPPPRRAEELSVELDPPMEPARAEKLPEDAILTPQAEDLATSPEEQEIALDEETHPAAPPPPPPPPKPAKRAPTEAVTVSDEISFEDEPAPPPRRKTAFQQPPPGPGGSHPIADLLSSEAEEEVELLSISSDEEAAGARPTRHEPDEAELEAAFGNISLAPDAPRRKVPAKKVPLFDDLSQDAFVELVNKLSYHRHVPGQLIIREGDPGRSFYVIVEGKVRIYKVGPDEKEITLAHLGEGAFFGEMALLSGAPRAANVVAEEDTEILEVTDVVLRDLARKHPQVVSSLKNFYRQRLLNNVMAISPLFKDFDPAERKAIVEKFKMRQAAADEVLITEGKNSDGLYVVLHGGVQVATRKDTYPVELARLKEGDIFGEMSLLTRKPATATVTSQGNSILLRLPRESFQELVLTHPQILELVSELTERRKSATEAILQGQGPGHDGMSFV